MVRAPTKHFWLHPPILKRITLIPKIQQDVTTHYVWCLGHIINLSLQAFFFATSKEALQAAIEAIIEAAGEDINEDTLESFARALASQSTCQKGKQGAFQRATQDSQPREKRQKCGRQESAAFIEDFSGIENLLTLQKLHRLAVWVRSSSLHSDFWDEAIGFRLGIDNTTCWSSWFTLIDKALKKQTQIKAFMVSHEQILEDIKLIVDDWDLLYKTYAFFQPFAGLMLCK